MADSLDVSAEELCMAIRLWLRGAPKWIWQRDLEYERLKLEKRHDPSKEPDPRGDLAAYITDRFVRVQWTVSRAKPENIFEGIGEGTDWREKRGMSPVKGDE